MGYDYHFTCSGCDSTWTGTSRAHCSADGCHRTFAGATLFDAHRYAASARRGWCADPALMERAPADGGPVEPLMYLVDGVWHSTPDPAKPTWLRKPRAKVS